MDHDVLIISVISAYLNQGELEHRRVKRFYARTNKNNAVRQMTRLERREHALRRLIHINQTGYDTETIGHKKRKVIQESPKPPNNPIHPVGGTSVHSTRVSSSHLTIKELSSSYTHFPQLNERR
jgi:hypothetical protein